MKRFALKRITAFVLALIMTLSLCPVTAFAEEQAYTDDQVYIATEDAEAIPEEESAPAEEEETPVAEEAEDSENDETVAMSEMATASSPAANAAATTHSHPICGKNCSCTSDSHPDFKWIAWDGTTTLGGGNYYLTKDVVLSKTMILNYNYITYLCLNGHSITCEDTVFDIYSTRSLYITDCVGTGVIETTNDAYTITNNRLLSVWDGTIRNSCEYAFSAILTGKNTSTYVRGGTVESSKYGDAIFSDVGSRVYIYDGNIKGYRSAIGGQDDTTDTIGTLTISGGHMSSTQGYGVLDIQNGSLTMSGGYVDGNVEVYDELGTTTISGGTINGFLYTYSGNTIVNGGEMEIDASGNTEIYAGTFHGENYFRGENTSIFGGNFATSTDSDVYIRGKTWICGGYFNTIWAYSGTPLYLSGVPEIDVIHLGGYPSALSAQSEDGSGSYGGDTIDLILAIPYTAEDWKDGEVVVKNVKSDAVAAKFAIAVSEGYTEHRYLERSGNNLVLRVPPHGTWGGGNNVTWSIIDGTLTISGTGALASADSGTKYPWGNYLDEITAIVVEPGITSIPNYAFEYCENATTISLPETLTSLNLNAFNDCGSLNNLLLPSSLTSISGFSNTGYPAFIRCESLTDLYYLGTAEEWDALRSGKNITSCDSTMTIHFLQLNNSGATCTEAGKQPHYTFDKTSVYDDMYDMDKQPISQVETIPALGHRVVLEQATQVRPVQIENTDTIPFVLENGNYYSNNHTHSSSSQLRIVATHACTLTLHYGVSSESTYDKFYILHNNTQKDMISGAVTGKELTLSLAVGDVVVVKYTKDGSVSKNDDHGWVELDYEPITIAAGTEVSADILYPNCTDAVVCSYCDTVIKAASGHTFVDGVCSGCGATTGYCGDPQVNEGKDVIWVLDDGVMTISGTGDMDDYASVNKILGNVASVDYIVSRDWTSESITRAVIGEGVTSVGGGSFHGANYWVSALEEVSLPDSLKYIGDCAFEECDRLQEITIPKNVTSIREYAFKGCSNLGTITFAGDAPSRIETDAFNGVTATCYYPNNSTWTEAVRQDYGGDLTWISYSVCIEGHTWVDATCEEPKTCSVCGETEGDPLGHTEVIDAAVAPSCTATGLTEGKHCFVCDTVLIKQEVVDALGHDYESVVTAPACTEQGYTTHTCAVCADSYVDTYVAATGHDYGEWFVITAPTCTEKGKERHDCVNCDHFETREIAATGHTEVVDKAVAPTCAETGLTEGKHCSVCDAVLVVQEVVDAKGHDYGEFTPSDDEPSKTHKSNCTICGYETTSAHTFGDDGVCTACMYAVCTITFNANGGSGMMAAQSVASGVATALNANAFTRENYTFAGWNTKADGTGDAYADEATITVTSATTLYAQWDLAEAHWGLASGENLDEKPSEWTNWGTLTDAVKWTNALTSEKTAYIQLLTDVNTEEPLEFAEGKTTILDLNGCDIDRGLEEAANDGNVLVVYGNLTLSDTSAAGTGIITGGVTGNRGGGVYVCGTFTMNGGIITGNNAADPDGDEPLGNPGGGVYISRGTFTMNGGSISGNTASISGGGVYLDRSVFIMNGGSISENATTWGGGVYVDESSTFTMNNGSISKNIAGSEGGGVYHRGAFTMNGGTISENTATYVGGGVHVYLDTAFTMNGGTISENTVNSGNGGGVAVWGDFIMNNGSISGNATLYRGGGVATWNDGTFTMFGGSIKGNTGRLSGGVYIGDDGSMQLSNTPFISGNVNNGTLNEATGLYELGENGSVNNVYLHGSTIITVTGELTSDATIGVTTSTVPTLTNPICIAKSAEGYTLSDVDKAAFISDREYMNVFVAEAEGMVMLEPLAHEVSFDMQGHGSQVDSQVIEDGQLVTEPSIPVEEGYVFEGWYRDAEYTVSWDFDADTVTESTTLYAKWRIADGVLWCEDIPDQPYTGKALKPDINVYFGMIPLEPNKDYTVSYKNNTKVYAPVDTAEELAAFVAAVEAELESNPKAKTVTIEDEQGEDQVVTIAKVPQIIIKGKGNFSGTLIKYFVVAPVEINEDDFLIPALSVAHTGKNLLPKPVVTWNETGKAIKWKTDYEVYLNYNEAEGTGMLIQSADAKTEFKAAGNYSLTVVGKGNFTGTAPLSYTITQCTLMSKVKIGGWKSSLLWYADDDGVMQMGLLLTDSTKKVDGKPYELVEGEGEDYTATYYNNTAVGTATVVFTGNPDKGYVGQVTKTFKITGTALSKMQVNGLPKSEPYTGAYIEPQCTLYDKASDDDLPTGAYTIEYSNNKAVGTATIIFTGNPECGYTGTLKKTFKITAQPLTEDVVSITLDDNENISVPYVKGGAKPVVTVTTRDGAELTEGVDYTISYKNNTAVTEDATPKSKLPTMTIKFKGNYSGTVTKGFTITSGSLENATVTVSDIVFNAKGFKAPTVTITDADGKKLSAGKDYDKSIIYTYAEDVTLEDGTSRDEGDAVEKKDIIPAKTVICVQVEGMGAYEGTLAEATFRVTKLSLAKATFKVKNQTYTGKAITIDGSDFTTAKCGTEKLYEETDYVILAKTYKNNINKGTASVVIQGTGNYGGTKTVTFKIDAKPLFWFF